MGNRIEKIEIGKTSLESRAGKLVSQIWTRSADHHTGRRLLEMPYSKALQKTALDHSPRQSEPSCIDGGNHRRL